MLEIKIIRSANKYDIVVNNTLTLFAVRKVGILHEEVIFFDAIGSMPVATFREKRRPFHNPKTIILHSDKIKYQIESKKHCYVLEIADSIFSLCYKVFGVAGLYFNNDKVGDLEIITTDAIDYEKKIILSRAVSNYYPFIYLFVSIDHFDVN